MMQWGGTPRRLISSSAIDTEAAWCLLDSGLRSTRFDREQLDGQPLEAAGQSQQLSTATAPASLTPTNDR